MERDFLAAIGKEQQQQQDNGREESAFFGGGGTSPAMDWSFGKKPAAAPALMSFRSAAKEDPTLPQYSGFDGARAPASRMLTHQRSFGADSHGSPQYAAMHRAQPPQHAMNGARVIPVSSPFNQNNPMFRVQSSPSLPNGVPGGASFKQTSFAMNNAVANSTVGVYGTRDVRRPKTAQLTIFYAGSVNVFDNISAEKAQELMFLASRASVPNSTSVARRPEVPIFTPTKVTVPEVSPSKQMVFQKPQPVSPPVSVISKPITGVLQPASVPRSSSSSNIDPTVPKSSSPLAVRPISQAPLAVPPLSQAPSTQPATLAATTSAAIMTRAVPQARKASLARFLEKRKERVTSVAPYSSAKSPLESSDTFGSTNANDKSSCTDIALSSNHDESLCLGQPRNISFSQESPNTKLQI
ncbi:hypothetical protein EJB05_42960 [Eragrostis curvula]|uniref:Protein TIFY n=1 Tax=Eragrostis curvula TaxID=38414 RepID=A0A5J9TDV1_9POAL|nr:hypothetical protein EJB05_42960 [Eragrostis curvula]